MAARFFIWPRYALDIDGRRIVFPPTAGAALALLFRVPGHFVPTKDLIAAAYYGREDGGPEWAEGCVRHAIFRVADILRRAGVRVDGHQFLGYRVQLRDTPASEPLAESQLPRSGIKGPHRYCDKSRIHEWAPPPGHAVPAEYLNRCRKKSDQP